MAPSDSSLASKTSSIGNPPCVAQTLLLLGGLVLALVLWNIRGTSAVPRPAVLKAGLTIDAPFTLVTVDRDNLSCAMPGDIAGYSCGYSAPNQPMQLVPPAERTLSPYLTTDRQLYVVAGLFELPALKKRYEAEPPQGKPIPSLKRFTADCKIKLLGEVDAHLRWAPEAAWGRPERVWVAVPIKCKVVE